MGLVVRASCVLLTTFESMGTAFRSIQNFEETLKTRDTRSILVRQSDMEAFKMGNLGSEEFIPQKMMQNQCKTNTKSEGK